MAVFGNVRVLDCLNVGYDTDVNPFIGKISFKAEASDLTKISTELSVNTIAGATKGYLTVSPGLLIGTTDISQAINDSLDNIRNNTDEKTKIITNDNNISITTGIISVPQGISIDTTPIIEIKEDSTRIKTYFNTDIIQNIGSTFETNSTILANQGILAMNGDVIVGNGNLNVNNNAIITNDLDVSGITNLDVTNISNTLTITNGGENVTGDSIFNNNVDVIGDLTVDASGNLIVNALSSFNNTTTFTSGVVNITNNVPLIVDGLVTASNGIVVTNGDLQVLNGDVSIVGNLSITGTTSTIDTTNLNVTDNMILLNKNEVGSGVTLNISGFEIERGVLENYRIVFDEFEKNFKFGSISSPQVVALRDDDVNMNDGYIPVWNGITNQFETSSGLTNSEVTQLKNIDSNVISNTQWGYINNMDQDISIASNVTFNNVTISGDIIAPQSVLALSNITYDFGTNTQIDVNNTINQTLGAIFIQNIASPDSLKYGILNAPTNIGVVRNFVFIAKHVSATATQNYVQIIINADDFQPPYDPPTGTPPTLYTIEMRTVGQTANLIGSSDNKWYLLNACNCILTDNGVI